MSDPKGECPVDIQANEPQSGWGSKEQRKPSEWRNYCFAVI